MFKSNIIGLDGHDREAKGMAVVDEDIDLVGVLRLVEEKEERGQR